MSRLLNYNFKKTKKGSYIFAFSVVENTAVNHYMDGSINVFALTEGTTSVTKHRYELYLDQNNKIRWAFEQFNSAGRVSRDPQGEITGDTDD